MKRVVVLIFLVAAALVAAAGCRPRYATNPPEESPDDPILATVGDEAVTVSFFRIALSGLPLTLRTRYMTDQGKREFLEDLIDGMAYYLEGKRRNLDKSLEFQAEMEDRQKETLVQMEKDALFDALGPASEDELREFYRRYRQKEESAGRPPEEFDAIRPKLENSLNAQRYQQAYKDRVNELKKEYGLEVNDEAVAKMPKDVSMDDPIATSNAVSMDAREFYTWVRGLQGPLRKLAATESGRRFLVNLRVEWELLYSDAVAKGLSKTDEFARRTYIDEVSALGKATVEQITKDNIKATRAEAQAYYDDNKTQFGGRLFDDVVEEARERATRAKVARVRKELAQALRRDRYIVSYHRENIDKLDPSGFTKGEMGVFMYPLVPDDAPDAELDSLDLSLPANPPAG